MRIIGGRLKGRKLHAPAGRGLRPTADKVREALFDILSERIVGTSFLDLYAGTGAVGIEALSRGAKTADFVEQNKTHLRYLRTNLHACGLNNHVSVYAGSVSDFLKRMKHAYQLLFFDPPYGSREIEKWLPRLRQGDMILRGGTLIIEHDVKRSLPQDSKELRFVKTYRYGETALSFYGKS
ncbi:MAG: 16S rRNA (guanine(966)-N(2))-methyltransferase RsmD [Nitrospiria bacterium]